MITKAAAGAATTELPTSTTSSTTDTTRPPTIQLPNRRETLEGGNLNFITGAGGFLQVCYQLKVRCNIRMETHSKGVLSTQSQV